jgi:hypothetical protein
MPPPPRRFIFIFAVVATAGLAAEPENSPQRSIAREAIKGIKFQPSPKPAESPPTTPVLVSKSVATSDGPVMLPAYEVRAKPDRVLEEVTDSVAHHKSLESKALVKKGPIEAIFPFDPIETTRDGHPRAILPILRIRF